MLGIMDWEILSILQENGRTSYSQISRQVNLTPPAVKERTRKLEEAGIITGYHAAVNVERLGYPIICFVHLTMPPESEKRFIEFVQRRTEILECYITTGQNAFVLKVVGPSVSYLHTFLNRLLSFGHSTTYLVLSEVISRRIIKSMGHGEPPD